MTLSLVTLLMLFGAFGICLWAACLLVVFFWAVATVLALTGSWAAQQVRRWQQ